MEKFVQKASQMNPLSCGNPTIKCSYDSKNCVYVFLMQEALTKVSLHISILSFITVIDQQ